MRDLSKRDWLLILLSYQGAPDGLDPVRTQQAMFLFAETGSVPLSARYIFKPGPYGPISTVLYRDLDRLVADGLAEARRPPGRRWSLYRASDPGRAIADDTLQRIAELAPGARDAARVLFDIKTSIATQPFIELLRRIEREHPEAASRSVFAPRY